MKEELIESIIKSTERMSHDEALEFTEELCYALALEVGDTCSESQKILSKALIEVAMWHEGEVVKKKNEALKTAEVMN